MRRFKHVKTGNIYKLISDKVTITKFNTFNGKDYKEFKARLEWVQSTEDEETVIFDTNKFYIFSYDLNPNINLVLYESEETGCYWLRSASEFFDGRFEQITETANNYQEGGNHYNKKTIQPWDYVAANDLGFFEGNIVKYVTRWKDKGGVEDLKKARHYLDKLIELQK